MKEIVVVTNYLTDGGAERVLSELMAEWINLGRKVSVLQIRAKNFSDSYTLPKEIEVFNINTPTDNRFLRRFVQARELIKILNSRKNATVLALVNPAILLVGICSPFIKNRIVFSERCDPEQSPPKKLYRIVRDNLFRCADACVFQTPDAKTHFSKSIQSKGAIIPNPINAELPQIHKGKRKKTIVAVCRLNQQKNLPMMIYAFHKLSKEYPEYTLEIYGRGEDEKQLVKLIHSLALQDKVFLMGFSHQVYEKMVDAAMYVSSSNYEGISNSMLEALAMGVPTVCTDCPCGGARMFIKNEENGILIPVGDTDALYRAMKKVLDNPEFSKKLSLNAYKIREELPVQIIAEKWLEVL